MDTHRQRYHSIPLRAQRRAVTDDVLPPPTQRQVRPAGTHSTQTGAPEPRLVPRQQMPVMPDEDEQYAEPGMPRSIRRYIDQDGNENEVYRQGNKRIIVTHAKPPSSRPHWLLYVGVGMLAMLALTVGLGALATWWSNHQLDSQYGNPRTWQTDQVVGHGDSGVHPSHFVFMNLDAHVVVIEIAGGDVAHARIYSGPQIFGDNPASLPVTADFKDVNGDGKVDMLVHVGEQTIIYLNDGTQFKPQ